MSTTNALYDGISKKEMIGAETTSHSLKGMVANLSATWPTPFSIAPLRDRRREALATLEPGIAVLMAEFGRTTLRW